MFDSLDFTWLTFPDNYSFLSHPSTQSKILSFKFLKDLLVPKFLNHADALLSCCFNLWQSENGCWERECVYSCIKAGFIGLFSGSFAIPFQSSSDGWLKSIKRENHLPMTLALLFWKHLRLLVEPKMPSITTCILTQLTTELQPFIIYVWEAWGLVAQFPFHQHTFCVSVWCRADSFCVKALVCVLQLWKWKNLCQRKHV